jgi:ABC-type multidrug transport system fused ATPase/permease subunit
VAPGTAGAQRVRLREWSPPIHSSATGIAPADDGQSIPFGRGEREVSVIPLRLSREESGEVVLDECTFDTRPDRPTGFLGPNGAGKTTMLRAE